MRDRLEDLMETRGGQRLLGALCGSLGAALCAGCFWLLEARAEVYPSVVFLGPFAGALGALIALFPGHGRGATGELDRPPCGVFLAAALIALVAGIWFLDHARFGLD